MADLGSLTLSTDLFNIDAGIGSAVATVGGMSPELPGSAPTNALVPLPYAPSIRIQASQSAVTMIADGTCQGYIIAGDISGAILIITSHNPTTCEMLNEDMVLTCDAYPQGVKIVGWSNRGPNGNDGAGDGSTGSYLCDKPQGTTLGSAGSPVTFTVAGRLIRSISDTTGNSSGLKAYLNRGPRLMEDGYGRKVLNFQQALRNSRDWPDLPTRNNWLYNEQYTGVDTHNVVWFVVMRNMITVNVPQVPEGLNIISAMYPLSGQLDQFTESAANIGLMVSGSAVGIFGRDAFEAPMDQSVRKKMLVGNQVQVLAFGSCTVDGYQGGSSGGEMTAIALLNEQGFTVATNSTRTKNATGFTLMNRNRGFAPEANLGEVRGQYAAQVYEIVGYTRGELGNNPATLKSKMVEISTALMKGYGIEPITRQLVVNGDSRQSQDSDNYMPPYAQTIASLLCNPGSPACVPADVRVMNYAIGGQGIGTISWRSKFKVVKTESPYYQASPLSDDYLLGDGNDFLFFESDSNDTGGGTEWPGTPDTQAYARDLFSGTHTWTALGSWSPGSLDLTLSSISPATPIARGAQITGVGIADGTSTMFAGANQMSIPQATSGSAVALTLTVKGYVPLMQEFLAKGINIIWTASGLTTAAGGTIGYFGDYVRAHALEALDALPGGANEGRVRIFDLTQVQSDGRTVLGPEIDAYGKWLSDFIHRTERGKRVFVDGRDTFSAYGAGYAVQQMLPKARLQLSGSLVPYYRLRAAGGAWTLIEKAVPPSEGAFTLGVTEYNIGYANSPRASVLPVTLFASVSRISLIGPTSGYQWEEFELTLDIDEVLAAPVQFTFHDDAGGIFTPSVLTVSAGDHPTATVRYQPTATGNRLITITNNGGLTAPGPITFPVQGERPIDGDGTLAAWPAELTAAVVADPTGDALLPVPLDPGDRLRLKVDWAGRAFGRTAETIEEVAFDDASGALGWSIGTRDDRPVIDVTNHAASVHIQCDPAFQQAANYSGAGFLTTPRMRIRFTNGDAAEFSFPFQTRQL